MEISSTAECDRQITISTFKSSVDTTGDFIIVSSRHAEKALVHLLAVISRLLCIHSDETTTNVTTCTDSGRAINI